MGYVRSIRLEHYSYRTDQSYLDWIRRYLRYHQCGLWLVYPASNSITKAD
ncbi:phage integrase N-terminal SAM-like domain-containing protein [Picosynechococcus sp. PCC 7002]|nr:phage integrase N-terminal SAM-like domain-containing protein [Picosynechococcus sp. PCC 7002]